MGWDNLPAGTNVVYTAGSKFNIAADTALYAVWAEATHTHVWGAWTVTTPATCFATGMETRVCTINPLHTETRAIPALGHAYGGWSVTSPATCLSGGVETRVCARDASHRQTRAIAALGHAYGAYTITAAPTCLEAGLETSTCGRDAGHVLTRPLAALGHAYGAWTVVTPPTCLTSGLETSVCSRDSSHENSRPIPAIGHNWGAWSETTPATLDSEGEEHRLCGNDASHEETRPIPRLQEGAAGGGGGGGGGTTPGPGEEIIGVGGVRGNTLVPLSEAPTIQEVLGHIMESGMPTINIGNLSVPLAPAQGLNHLVWALINLLLAVAGILLAFGAVMRAIGRRKQEKDFAEIEYTNDGEDKQKKSRFGWLIILCVVAVVGIVVFLLTQDMTRLMVLVDNWTIVNAIIFAAALISNKFAFKHEEDEEDDEFSKEFSVEKA